jgi:hypothetical protein
MTDFNWSESIRRTLETLKDSRLAPLQRYICLEYVVADAYKYRHQNPVLRDLCECFGWRCYEEFSNVIEHQHWRSFYPTAIPKLVTILFERAAFEQAIRVCEQALLWGISDGTKTGYKGRIERIRKSVDTNQLKDLSATFEIPTCEEVISTFIENTQKLTEKRQVTRTVPDLFNPPEDYSLRRLSRKHREFYKKWVAAWEDGTALDIEGQAGYVFLYIQREVLRQPLGQAIKIILDLKKAYPDEKYVSYNCSRLLSDLFMLDGNYRMALEHRPPNDMDEIFSLKLALGEPLSGKEAIKWFGQVGLTGFGIQNLSDIEEEIGHLISERKLLQQWAEQCDYISYLVHPTPPPSRWMNNGIAIEDVRLYGFLKWRKEFAEEIKDIKREAENIVREKRGIPRIGEGWVGETQLYYELTEAFREYDVQHHASPAWLGKQHLDIFIPELHIAIEYQGLQHSEPVEFFGGEEAFVRRQELDERKRSLCEENGIKLIPVYPDYNLEIIIHQIKSEAK